MKSGEPHCFSAVRRQVKHQLYDVLVRIVLATAFLAASATTTGLRAQARVLPLPRFVSLKASSANLRIGPGTGYDIEWVMKRPGIPLEIYQQYGNWRRVRDWEGTTGWIYGSLLSGHQTAIVAPWLKDNVELRAKPAGDDRAIAWVEPHVQAKLTRCDGQWCLVTLGMMTGFIRQVDLWGVYPGEVL